MERPGMASTPGTGRGGFLRQEVVAEIACVAP